MNIQTFISKLEAGTIKLNGNGHQFNSERVLSSLLRSLKFKLDYHTEKLNDKPYHKIILDMISSSSAYGPNVKFMDGMDTEVQCWMCGSHGMRVDFLNIDTLHVVHWSDESVPCMCQVKDEPIVTQIQVPTGKLIFSNWFKTPEAPEGEEYGNDYCINALLGQINTAKHLAKNGFGYGQMGNSSVEIYVSKDKKSIKIIDGSVDYVIDEFEYCFESGKMNEVTSEMAAAYRVYKNISTHYDCVGSICMSVWRWMCADAIFTDDVEMSDETIDPVYVAAGTWEITHNHSNDEDAMFASEMRLI